MKRIPAREFLAMIKKNPSVFEHWDTPLHITTPVNCENSLITHPDGVVADFLGCPNLHTLENWDLYNEITIEPEKLATEIKRRATFQKFLKESQPKPLPFL
jgi:hypothetical protein